MTRLEKKNNLKELRELLVMWRFVPFYHVLLFLFASVVLALATTQSYASVTPDPTEQLRPFIDKVIKTLSDPTLKKLPKQEQGDRVIEVVRERFDFQEMSKRVVGQPWRNLSPQDQKDFEQLFTRLLQYAYISKIDDYAGQQVQFVQQRIKGDRAEVQTLLVDAQKSIPVSYIMQLHDGQWLAYDVVVEGVSLIRNYMEQFNEIIRKEGFPGLMKQVAAKVGELEKTIKK